MFVTPFLLALSLHSSPVPVAPAPSLAAPAVRGGYLCLGQQQMVEGKWEEALASFRKAREIGQKPPEVSHASATALARLDRADEAIKELRRAFSEGFNVGAAYHDEHLTSLRNSAEFRKALRDNASATPLVLAAADEPGARMMVELTVVDSGTKRPIAGALVYAFHTDAKGEYGGGGAGEPRLFGYVLTDAKGVARLHSIRPVSHPENENPQHIHLTLGAAGYVETGSEIFFADDPNLTAENRREVEGRAVIAQPQRMKKNAWQVRATFELDWRGTKGAVLRD